jgi:RNA polymerase sigma-70 factor (ECF subfamily)
VISSKLSPQFSLMDSVTLVAGAAPGVVDEASDHTADVQKRLRAMLADHYDFIWRTLRRLGLDPSGADDAAQQVFVVVSRKLDGIRAGGERAYLFGIALRVASESRRAAASRREHPSESAAEDAVDPAPSADEMLDQRRARALLDRALEALPVELRLVFTLHELEEMSMSEISALVGIAPGTVASRLRRARQEFETAVARVTRSSASVRGATGRSGEGGR